MCFRPRVGASWCARARRLPVRRREQRRRRPPSRRRTCQGCTTLQQLQNEMKKDAGRLDGSAAAGLTSFVTQTDRLQELEARIDLKIKELAGARAGDSGRPRQQHSRAVMTNPATPPDSSKRWQWCEHHGSWSTTHKSSGCYIAHPELAPKRD